MISAGRHHITEEKFNYLNTIFPNR